MQIIDLLPPFIIIPSTPFLMGTPERDLSGLAKSYGGTRESYREEAPQHRLTLPAFAIAQVPVTNRLYTAYVAAAGTRMPITWHGQPPPDALLDHPVVDVSWVDAQAFCAWLNDQILDCSDRRSTVRLPTEAEWEHAARGGDGRVFPWGNEWDSARANTRDGGPGSTIPAGGYTGGASFYGCLDMAGNVWEWTSSMDALYPYIPADGREDRQALGRRILRGGCYANPCGFARCACRFRLAPTVHNEFLGFRLAR